MKTFFTLICTCLLITAGKSYAQNCNGEVIKFQETFGTGNKGKLTAGKTNYNFRGSGALNDGDYALLNTSQGKPEWHSSPDHTGNTNGRMMVTNASYEPGEFYRDTVIGVSSVATYNIYFYAMNVNTVGTCSPNPILPKLQLIVESYNYDETFTEIYRMSSDYLPQTTNPTWVKISGQFYLPTQCTAIRYRIINNSTGGCGNDLAIDDITFSQCQPAILPANGLTLKGKAENNSALLTWTTVSEINTNKFIVEKSTDSKVWKDIASIQAAGTSNTMKEYKYADPENSASSTYYRILAVDGNGRETYSNSILVRYSSDGNDEITMSAFPNPFTSLLKLEINSEPEQNVSVRIFDIHGKMIRNIPWALKKGMNSISIGTLDHLSQGLYFLSVINREGKTIGKTKVLKQ